MSDENKVRDEIENQQEENQQEQYSLNDDRRVRTLSPGALVAKRFFRNRVAVTGLVILAFMFVFSFIGGAVTPYDEDQLFYRDDEAKQQYAGVTENTELRYVTNPEASFSKPKAARPISCIPQPDKPPKPMISPLCSSSEKSLIGPKVI